MNGHDDYFNSVSWADQNKEFDLEGNEIPEDKEPYEGFDNEETPPKLIPGNQMIDREPQEELDRVSNRESYSFFQNNCQYEE